MQLSPLALASCILVGWMVLSSVLGALLKCHHRKVQQIFPKRIMDDIRYCEQSLATTQLTEHLAFLPIPNQPHTNFAPKKMVKMKIDIVIFLLITDWYQCVMLKIDRPQTVVRTMPRDVVSGAYNFFPNLIWYTLLNHQMKTKGALRHSRGGGGEPCAEVSCSTQIQAECARTGVDHLAGRY